jgi:nitroreductase
MSTQKILEAAIHAPSGENCQPWEFAVSENQIRIFNVPERDPSLFNARQRASMVAHGALIENVMIASSALGFDAQLTLFPESTNPDYIAAVALEATEPGDEPLYPYIKERNTNRKQYKPVALTAEQKAVLTERAGRLHSGEVRLVETKHEKHIICDVISLNDSIAFDNPHIHRFFFDHIRWDEREARDRGDGLDIRTLEISPLQAIGFRLLKNWSLVAALNKVGLSKGIALKAKNLCRSASAAGIVMVEDDSRDNYLTGGRLLQRVWLEATRMGLSFHPMAGIAFLMQRVIAGETEDLAQQQIRCLTIANKKIRTVFKLKNETIVMIFRIGQGEPPSARSERIPLEKLVRRIEDRE